VCAYQFLSGRLPHEYGSLTELALKQQSESVESIRAFRPEVPEPLDRAVRVCLDRDPAARYASALDMATAMEAGLHGDEDQLTQVLERTQALGAADIDATQAMPRTTASTRAMPQGAMLPPPTREEQLPPARRQPDRQARKSSRGRGLRRLIIALAVVLAIVAVVLIATSGGGGNKGPVNSGDVHGQVDGLKQLIQDNEK
jgi:hypothetical protein